MLAPIAILEGLSAGPSRVAPNIPMFTVGATAAGLGVSVGSVRGAVALAMSVAVAVIAFELVRMRRGSGALVGLPFVALSWLLMTAALLLVAVSSNLEMLAGGLALMGLPLAVLARFRHAAIARFPGREGTFVGRAHVWNRVGWAVMSAMVGLAAVPGLGWRWAAATAAGWFALLAVAFAIVAFHEWRPGTRPGRSAPVTSRHTREGRLSRQWRLDSVKGHIGTMFLASAILQVAVASMDPALRAAQIGPVTLVVFLLLLVVQLGLAPIVKRTAKGADDSTRRAAVKATWWLPLVAPAALIAADAPGPVVAVVAVLAWLAAAELGYGGASAATRVGLARIGQLSSLMGAFGGYLGSAAGSLLLQWDGLTPRWLAAGLLLGAVAAVGVAHWTPRYSTRRVVVTTSTATVLNLSRGSGKHRVRVTVAGRPEGRCHAWEGGRRRLSGGAFQLGPADALQALAPYDSSSTAETVDAVRLVCWPGNAGLLWRVVAALRPRVNAAGGPWPLDIIPFVVLDGRRGFAGYVRWTGPGVARIELRIVKAKLVIGLVQPRESDGVQTLRWRLRTNKFGELDRPRS